MDLAPVPRPASPWRRMAGWVASGPWCAPARRLMERNLARYDLPLSHAGKLAAGSWLILRDYADGRFPPRFEDQQAAYRAEMEFHSSMNSYTREQSIAGHVVKPFWTPRMFSGYTRAFTRLWEVLQALDLGPGARLLELGCGAGWMTEFLALGGFSLVGTTIAPDDIAIGEGRVRSLVARGLPAERLQFRQAPMESVDAAVADLPRFDAVFVFEALHHAYDWQAAIHAAARCLKPGGWLLLANEPNRLHTFVSYRVSRLTNTHEIGMSGPALRAELRRAGLDEIRTFAPRLDLRITAHWVAGRSAPAPV
ncbi:MAG: class I SAM-dependent methyltransferase [Verrucomicrobia bacterium]|nr:class I SAM-dependent methyltransferase [Verrucomicrobiota bacterium]